MDDGAESSCRRHVETLQQARRGGGVRPGSNPLMIAVPAILAGHSMSCQVTEDRTRSIRHELLHVLRAGDVGRQVAEDERPAA
jgi:hypothetical protein